MIAVLLVTTAVLPGGPALAQDSSAASPTPAPTPAPAAAQSEGNSPEAIIVIGDRAIIASLKDVPVERTYDEDEVASYVAGSVGEVIDAIREENNDEDPTILVNGRPVTDTNDISDLPPEAIARIETLPRGSAQRVNGAPGQRAYNVVLKRQVRTAIVTASDEVATEGGWSNARGELQLTRIAGQNRINLAIRGARSGYLLESERDFVGRREDPFYASGGNILPAPGRSEVDPILSAVAGKPVLSVALPAGNAQPSLGSLVSGANALNPSVRSGFRSLRSASRPLDLSLSGNQQLTEQLSLSFNARAGWSDSRSLLGVPRARVTVPTSNAFTPFTVPVSLYLEDPSRVLEGRNEGNSQGVSVTLNAMAGDWRGSANARFDRREQDSIFAFAGSLPALAAGTNPFGGSLAAQIPIVTNTNRSVTRTLAVGFEASGPLAELWAGPIEARFSGLGQRDSYVGTSSAGGNRSFNQRQISFGSGITLPLTSRSAGFLPAVGDSELAFDIGWVRLNAGFGTLRTSTLAFNWQPLDWLRLAARTGRIEAPISPILLAEPANVVPEVLYFDPITGQTVEVTSIFGGIADLVPEDRRTHSIAVTATPWKEYNLQLDAEYTVDDLRNQIGALPEPTPAVLAAFPDRFLRDASGTLILVDGRSINLARQRGERLRFGLRYTLPLGAPPRRVPATDGRPAYRTKQTKLQVSFSHTELLSNTSVIRAGLPVIDLLDGTAVGFGGAQPRGTTNANLALTRGPSGARMEFRRRGASKLLYGTLAAPQLLEFEPLTTLDLKVYADLGEVFRSSSLAKGARFTVAVDNAFNTRQNVVDTAGFVPQAFQPIRRDALGRTVQVELRKSF